MSPISKFIDTTVALVETRAKSNIAGKVTATPIDSLTRCARAHLVTAFEALHSIQVGYGSPTFLICERDDATLRVTGLGLVHDSSEAKVLIEHEHWTDDPSGALSVNGHIWSLSEMVDGVIAATKDLIDFALGDPVPQPSDAARKPLCGGESTARLLETAKTLIKVHYGNVGPAEDVRAKLADCGVNAGPVTAAAVIAMLEQTAETCRRAAFPLLDEAIVRLKVPNAKETMP